jgi:hypothetical protein
MKEVL